MKVVIRPGSGPFKTAKTLGPTVPMPLLVNTSDAALEIFPIHFPAQKIGKKNQCYRSLINGLAV